MTIVIDERVADEVLKNLLEKQNLAILELAEPMRKLFAVADQIRAFDALHPEIMDKLPNVATERGFLERLTYEREGVEKLVEDIKQHPDTPGVLAKVLGLFLP